jgi:hypothetical protein
VDDVRAREEELIDFVRDNGFTIEGLRTKFIE